MGNLLLCFRRLTYTCIVTLIILFFCSGTCFATEFDQSQENHRYGDELLSSKAGDEFCNPSYCTYRINDDLKSVTLIKFDSIGAAIIPSTVEHNSEIYTVTAVGDEAFNNHSSNASPNQVTLPDTVTKLGDRVFYERCKVSVFGTFEEIGEYAFENCSLYTSIQLSESMVVLGRGAFAGVSFYSNNTGITLPANLKTIPDNLFKNSDIETISIPSSVTAIGDSAFENCINLSEVELPDGLASIGYRAFNGCSGLTYIELPSSVETVYNGTFSKCPSLISVSLPISLTLKNSPMYNDETERVFSECPKLEEIYLTPGNGEWSITNGYKPWKDPENQTEFSIFIADGISSIPNSAFGDYSKIKDISIPGSVKTIGVGAFANCAAIMSITLEEGIENISNSAFQNCVKLENINLPDGLVDIGNNAFFGCTNLKTVYIPDSVEKIGKNAFCASALGLTEISDSVTYIGPGAFSSCDNVLILSTPDTYVHRYCKDNSVPFIGIKAEIQEDEISVGNTTNLTITYEKPNDCSYRLSGPSLKNLAGNTGMLLLDKRNLDTDSIVRVTALEEGLATITLGIATNDLSHIIRSIDIPVKIETTPAPVFEITFLDEKGNELSNPITKRYSLGKAFGNLPTIADITADDDKVLYDLEGWYTLPGGKGTHVTDETVCNASLFGNGLYLYGKRTPRTITVEFDRQNGTSSTIYTIPSGSTVFAPYNTPQKDNCTFSGWYTKPYGEGEQFKDETVIYTDTTFYAYWSYEVVSVSYDKSVYDSAKSMLEGSDAELLNNAHVYVKTKYGYSARMYDNYRLTFTSSNSNVARVDNGRLVAVKQGSAVITVNAIGTQPGNKVSDRINVRVVKPVTGVTLDKTVDSVKSISTTKLTARVAPATGADTAIKWSVYAKYNDSDEFKELTDNSIARVTTLSTSGAVTVGQLSVNTRVDDDKLRLKVRATASNLNDGTRIKTDNNDYIYAEKEFEVLDTTPVTGVSLKPAATTVNAVSSTTIKATVLPNGQDVDRGLAWSVYSVNGGNLTPLATDSGIYVTANRDAPEATLHVNLATRSALNVVRVRADSTSNYDDGSRSRNENNKLITGYADITVKPMPIPEKISFDKKAVDAIYGDSITLKVTPSLKGADPNITLKLWRNNADGSRTEVMTNEGIKVSSYNQGNYSAVTFSTDCKEAISGEQSFTIRAESTYAYSDGTNQSSESNHLIFDESVINVRSRYTISESSLNAKVGDENHLTIRDNKTNKTIKASQWITSDESVAAVTSDGIVKALKGGNATIQPILSSRFSTGSYIYPVRTEDGREISTNVTVAEEVRAPYVSIAGGRDTLEYGDLIYLITDTENASIKVSTGTGIVGEPSNEYNGPITVGDNNTEAVEGDREKRTITITAMAYKTDSNGEIIKSPVRTYTYYVFVEDTTAGEVETGDVPASGINDIPSGIWMSEIEAQKYTGEKIIPEIRVYDGKKRLVENTDYAVSVKNNLNAHDATEDRTSPTMTVTLKKNYSGKLTRTFAINKVDISSDPDIVTWNYDGQYTGKEQLIIPTVEFKGKKLKHKTDYTIEYPDLGTGGAYKNPNGESENGYAVKIVANPKSNFTGSRTVYLKIRNSVLLSNCTISNVGAQKYTGTAITPAISIRYKGKLLVQGSDYNVSYENNIAPGKATILISASDIGGYFGTVMKEFTISPVSISSAKITGLGSKYPYQGNDVRPFDMNPEPTITLKVNGTDKVLEKDTDYKVVYSKNNTAGTATAKITGIGICSGSKSFSFKIDAYDIDTDSDGKVSVSYPEAVYYNLSGAYPSVTIKYGDTVLVEKQDYTISFKNNRGVGTAADKNAPTITIKGKGAFKGTLTRKYSIVKTNLADTTIYANDVVFKNKAGAYVTKIKLTDVSGKTLSAGRDYDKQLFYCYDEDTVVTDASTVKKGMNPVQINRIAGEAVGKNDIVPSGTTIRLQVLGTGNFSGSRICKYRISDKSISSASCSFANNKKFYYKGKPVYLTEDDLIVKVGGKQLPSQDYAIVGYEKNINVGTATVIIRGQGDYVGDRKITFKILQKQ